MRLETPVLFLIFNRPEVTKISFDRISKVRPSKLFIAADGPRKDVKNDFEKCVATRELVINSINWDCEVKTLLRDTNLGCGKAVSEGITWFFENVDEGIIIEDDVLPDESFFYYCAALLRHYEEDERIMHISGLNVAGTWKYDDFSYLFSKLGTIWGWASWRRAWKQYDLRISSWKDPNTQNKILEIFPAEVRDSRRKLYDDLYNKKIDTWDFQWTYARILNSGLSIIPSSNLVKNIDFGEGGTHISLNNHPWANLNVIPLEIPLKHPVTIVVDENYDLFHLGVKK